MAVGCVVEHSDGIFSEGGLDGRNNTQLNERRARRRFPTGAHQE